MVILEGSVLITERASGRQHQIEAGTILSHPKGVDLRWQIRSPFLKKMWVLWDSPQTATKEDHLYVANISDNPPNWTPFEWVEPDAGPQVCGETYIIRGTGSTGSYRCGLWRTGVGVPGCAPDGSATVRYTAPLGDEMILLLEGQAHLVNEETGEEHDLKAGDIVGLPSGLPVTWTSKAPYVKKFFVITNEALPAS
ncbi:MAG: cupin domain-containing protein [Pseudonocardia sp.]